MCLILAIQLQKDVMIPRIDMTFIDINFSYDELMAVFSEDMHTRFPVMRTTLIT